MIKLRRYATLTLLSALIGLSATTAYADTTTQQSTPSREQIQKEKKMFLTKELDLTDQEAEALMKILNELDAKRFRLWKSCTSMLRRMDAQGGGISDEEYEKYFTQVMDNRVREAELERTYYTKCKAVIPVSKLVKLERANRAFARQFMKRTQG